MNRSNFFTYLRRDPVATSALTVVLMVLTSALIGPWLSPYGFDQTGPAQLEAPSWQHWCGTDLFGRDLLTRMLHGARLSLLVAAVGAGVSLVIGVSYGLVAGYSGGRTDQVMMRVVEVLYSLPRLVFVIVLIAVLQKHTERWLTALHWPEGVPQARLLLLFIGLGCVEWLTMARIVRGQVLVLRESQFVQAARALGQSHWGILHRHLLPNIAGVALVYLTLTLPVVMLEESFLSFLGLGVQPPAASWGALLSSGAQQLNPLKIAWWLLLFPGGMMALTLIALNLLGDSLRDQFDPRKQI